ncbi:hypothetical protein MRX96_043337 [Rhipicephalus microplus]
MARGFGAPGKNAEGPKPAQLYDLTHPRGAHSFHELLSDQELEYTVDYPATIALRRPECVGDGNASAHMLSASAYAELRNAYETILAKVTYRSISKNAAELPQILLQNTFPGAGCWSGYWNSERNPYKRSVQDMLLHNMMGLPVYGTAPCRLRDVVDARAYRACSRLAHLTAYFPVHRHAECSVTVRPHEQPWNDSRKKYHLKLEEATCSAAMLRASLLPYTFTALYQSQKSGAMLARPMFFEAIRLEVFLDDDEQAAGDLFQLPPKEPEKANAYDREPLTVVSLLLAELEALVTNNYSFFHFFYVKGALTGHCSPCAVKTPLSCITLYGLKRRPSAVEINGRLLLFNTTDRGCAFHTGRRALRLERTTEPEPKLNIGASPSIPELKLSPPYEWSTLPIVALSYGRREDPHTQPPRWVTTVHHGTIPEAVLGHSGERDEEKREGGKDNRPLATGDARGAFLSTFEIHDS